MMNLHLYEKLDIEELQQFKEGATIYKNYYWLTIDGSPVTFTLYGSDVMCNRQKAMAELMVKRWKSKGVNAGYIFLPLAYVMEDKRIKA
jgi:hypothetical protein